MKRMSVTRVRSGRSGRRRGSQKPGTIRAGVGAVAALGGAAGAGVALGGAAGVGGVVCATAASGPMATSAPRARIASVGRWAIGKNPGSITVRPAQFEFAYSQKLRRARADSASLLLHPELVHAREGRGVLGLEGVPAIE